MPKSEKKWIGVQRTLCEIRWASRDDRSSGARDLAPEWRWKGKGLQMLYQLYQQLDFIIALYVQQSMSFPTQLPCQQCYKERA